MYKACIFDLDGTLANTLPSLCYIGNAALERCGFDPVDDSYYPMAVGNGANKLISRLLKLSTGNEADEGTVMRVRSVYDEIYASDPLYLAAAYDGICDLLSALAASGIKTAVLSNKPDDMSKLVVEGLFPNHKFDIVFGQREGVPRKPSPDAALEIAELLGIDPEDFLFVGDTCVDMQTGNSAKMTPVGVLWGFRSKEELIANGARHLISAPLDLLSVING